jgi:hypothetical protein
MNNNTELGCIFHLGIYSVMGFDDIKSSRKRNLKNGSEWYLKRLIEKGNYRPVSGWKETQEYHKNNLRKDNNLNVNDSSIATDESLYYQYFDIE